MMFPTLASLLFLPALQAPSPRPSAPVSASILPPELEALNAARNWSGMADWFETQTPRVRGQYVGWWLRSLDLSHRWARLLQVCDALQAQLEAKTGPGLEPYRIYRAQALGQLGRHQEAAQAHAENGRLGYPPGLANACIESRLALDWDGLLAYAGEFLTRTPGNPNGLAWKGEALSRLGRFAEAEPVLQAAVKADATQAMAWNNLGRCLNERKDWTDAREALDHALALEPKEFEALFNRGRCLFELHEYAASRDDFRAALALRPNDPVLMENLRQAERYAAVQAPPRARR